MSQTSVARAMPTSLFGSRKVTVAIYGTAVFLYWMALYLYVPTLGTYTATKTDNLALVGVVLSQYGLWQAIIRLPLGIAADWIGRRKPFIIVGFGLAGLGAWIMGMTDNVNGLILGRAVTGLAAGTWVPLVVVFSSLFPPREAVRASALLTLIGSVGRVLATGVTGSLNGLGGYSLAFFLAAATAGLAILIVMPAREQARPPKAPSFKALGTLIVRRDVLLPALLNMLSLYANWASTYGFLPILAQKLGATDVMQSLLVSINIAVTVLGNLFATALVKRTGAQRLVYASFVFLALGIAAAALAPSLPLVFVAQILIGLSYGGVYPVLMGMSIEHVADAERTTAMGLHQAVYAWGMFAGPWLSGILADVIGIRPMFGVTAFATLTLGLFVTRWLTDKGAAARQ